MFGTFINMLAIISGGIMGLLIRGGLKEKYKAIVMQAVSLSVIFIGLSGTLSKLILPEANPILFILCMVIGGLIGELIDIDGRMNSLGNFIQSRLVKGESNVSKGFVYASLIYCVGTMSIIGSIEAGTQGNYNTLFAKSILDGISSIIFSSTMGVGVLLSSVSVLVYQGSITLLSSVIAQYLTEDMLREMSIVGGILITALGLDLLGAIKMKIGNMLPAIFLPVIYYLLLGALGW